ncbi:DUF1996 domain-containing protein [Actinoplanes sp. N902-109]|uniref:DUF1996 domain-containing protein n=1 Tax=Actinoplanes sp. (strain N902-109) TaxID=649831 RepID=UPI00032941C9|nr:DUF1996 domain-containing protein [Actinoplanes sp. N902-109]AGL19664.1 hypothetical protein L083_6154 [Actinoplanes sp. N902-109]
MRMTPAHVAPPDPVKKRRRRTRIALAAAVVAAVGGSGVYIAGANAGTVDVPGRLQAENFAAQSGAQTEGTGDADGGKNVGWLADGDFLRYDNVAVTGTDLTARVASDNSAGGTVELHLGSQTGTLLGVFKIAKTGGWQKWTTVTAKAPSAPAGPQTVFAVMKSAQKSDFVNINWFTLGPVTAASTTPTAPSSAAPAPSASGSASAPAAGYVKVDQAAWQKQLDLFNAAPTQPVPAGITKVPEFHVDCTVAGSADDDPIVFPNMPGASHNHTFFGQKADAAMTTAKLLAGTTNCSNPGDLSSYWAPTLLKDGKAVPMKAFRVYYGNGTVTDPATIKPFPPGLKMVVGDAKKQEPTPKGTNGQFWCAGSAETGRSADGNWPKCAAGGNLIYQLTFKSCWDGVNIDSPDHKSHMGNPVGGKCTGDYPVAVPNISLMLGYDSLGGDGLTLSSGMASSIHGDMMNAWQPEELAKMVKVCITQGYKCGDKPTFVGG